MPRRWRRKYSALYDNVLESGLSDAQLAMAVRLQAVLHRAWRTDPVCWETWQTSDARKVLSEAELHEVTGVRSLAKARAKLLTLSGCDPYRTGTIDVEKHDDPRGTGPHRGARPGAQTVRVVWRNFGQILNAHGPRVRPEAHTHRPYEVRRTKNGERPYVVPGQVPSPTWDDPTEAPPTPTPQERELERKAVAELKEKLRQKQDETRWRPT